MRDLDPPAGAVRAVVVAALAEDFGLLGDLTSLATIDAEATATGRFVVRADGVLAGSAAATETYRQLDPDVRLDWHAHDGDSVGAGTAIATITGPTRSLLGGERTALNFLQHCSGIATLTRRFVDSAAGRSRIRDTRKTLPGLRALEKAAVRAGGGFNHRESLSDAMLVKDNHLAGLDLKEAVERCRSMWPGRVVEVECDTLEQVAAAVEAGADLVLLDNMSPAQVREARRLAAGSVDLEVSGGVTLETVADYAATGVEYISLGAITHSAPALDIGLDF
jgi:nicotinate-nucleotide pyrophosphorylase (carboxylating)